MELVRLIREKVAPRGMSAEQLQGARPLRNSAVATEELADGSLSVVAPLAPESRLMAVIAKSMKLPDTRQFELDPVGGFVWSLCDGRTTFKQMNAKVQAKYKMNRLEAEAALSAYLQTLAKRRLITILVKRTR